MAELRGAGVELKKTQKQVQGSVVGVVTIKNIIIQIPELIHWLF